MKRKFIGVFTLLVLVMTSMFSIVGANERTTATFRLGSVSLPTGFAKEHSGEILMVTIKISIAQEGVLNGVEVVKSSGIEILDNAVIDAARRGQYSPIYDKDGKAIEQSLILPLKFDFTQKASEAKETR
jgi:TonB family protein